MSRDRHRSSSIRVGARARRSRLFAAAFGFLRSFGGLGSLGSLGGLGGLGGLLRGGLGALFASTGRAREREFGRGDGSCRAGRAGPADWGRRAGVGRGSLARLGCLVPLLRDSAVTSQGPLLGLGLLGVRVRGTRASGGGGLWLWDWVFAGASSATLLGRRGLGLRVGWERVFAGSAASAFFGRSRRGCRACGCGCGCGGGGSGRRRV